MKTLIINGSPRRRGDTSELLAELKKQLKGEIVEISAYYDKIAPCIDCRMCWKKKGCVIKDDMAQIYKDDFDTVVLASPLYMSNLTGPMVSLASRFQSYYAAKRFLRDEMDIRSKVGVLILVGGGDGGPEPARIVAEWMFKHMKAGLKEENIVLSLNTDKQPAKDDLNAMIKMKDIACRLNQMDTF
ncbi:multimeric flavodoxin WrbA [Anaerotaenia torta]|uniref:flavodoxin family protein n=1 Tax=Anaerotaenia torta TaxID=433293 RepID=UPI003D1A2CA1